MPNKPDFKSIDEYIATFPEDTQKVLSKIRKHISKLVPDAEQVISYQIPCFKVNGKYLIYFAGYDKHIGVYPVHPSEYPFAQELEPYMSGKATLKFPLDVAFPYDLIEKIVKFKLQQLA